MKITQVSALILTSLTLTSSVVDAGLILNAGQSFELEFSSISSTAPFSDDPFGYAGFNVGTGIIESDFSVLFSVFEDNTSQPALQSGTFDGTTIPPAMITGGGYLTSVALAPWQDLQGIFKVEVISGTIELSSFDASTVIGGQYYEQSYAVPEPNSVALLFTGVGVLYLRRKRISNQKLEPTC